MDADTTQENVTETGLSARLVMPLAALLALLSASCCVLPIGLSIIGLGGSWLTLLGPFVAYRGAILSIVDLALVWAWYRILRPNPCEVRTVFPTIWTVIASVTFLVALSSPYWEGLAQRFMWDLWRSTR
jgi:mercuric ion transport protein